MGYEWHFAPLWHFLGMWAHGWWVTAQLSALTVLCGTLLGALCVIGQRSNLFPIVFLCRLYVDVFRSIPALVLIGTLFFLLPSLPSVGWRGDPFQTAFLALTLNLAPFAAEILRSGIESVGKIQFESARVLGFSEYNSIRYVIGPQVVRRIIPPLVGEIITTVKLTSLAATIGVPEVWNVTSQIITITSLPVEARLVGGGLYALPVLLLLWLSRYLERHFHVRGLGTGVER